MHKASLLTALLLLPACAATTMPVPAEQAGGTCNHEGLDSFVGQKVTPAMGADLLAKSGARTLRWGPPRSAMTMDFREDRLTISYDDDMIITSARCG